MYTGRPGDACLLGVWVLCRCPKQWGAPLLSRGAPVVTLTAGMVRLSVCLLNADPGWFHLAVGKGHHSRAAGQLLTLTLAKG